MLGKPLSPSQESSAHEGAGKKLKPTPLHSTDSTRGNPEGTSEPGVTQQGGDRPELDTPPRVACAGLAHQPALLPGLASSSTLRKWILTARPLLLGMQYSCTPYLMQSVKSAGWGRHPHLVDGDTEAGKKGHAGDHWQGQLQVTPTSKTFLRYLCWMTSGPKDKLDFGPSRSS